MGTRYFAKSKDDVYDHDRGDDVPPESNEKHRAKNRGNNLLSVPERSQYRFVTPSQ